MNPKHPKRKIILVPKHKEREESTPLQFFLSIVGISSTYFLYKILLFTILIIIWTFIFLNCHLTKPMTTSYVLFILGIIISFFVDLKCLLPNIKSQIWHYRDLKPILIFSSLLISFTINILLKYFDIVKPYIISELIPESKDINILAFMFDLTIQWVGFCLLSSQLVITFSLIDSKLK